MTDTGTENEKNKIQWKNNSMANLASETRWHQPSAKYDKAYDVRMKAVTDRWISINEPNLLGLVTSKVKWHERYQRQEYSRGDIKTCLYASTANGARDLGLVVPDGFERQVISDPDIRNHFDTRIGGGYRIDDPEAQISYKQVVQKLIRGSRVTVNPTLSFIELVMRLNEQKPIIVVVMNGAHAVELNAVFNENGKLAFPL